MDRLAQAFERDAAQRVADFYAKALSGEGYAEMHRLGLRGASTAAEAAMTLRKEAAKGGSEEYEQVRSSLREELSRSSARVVDLFKKWDVDNNGTISRAEFRRAIEQMDFDCFADDIEIDRVFNEFDTDGSGLEEDRTLPITLVFPFFASLHAPCPCTSPLLPVSWAALPLSALRDLHLAGSSATTSIHLLHAA